VISLKLPKAEKINDEGGAYAGEVAALMRYAPSVLSRRARRLRDDRKINAYTIVDFIVKFDENLAVAPSRKARKELFASVHPTQGPEVVWFMRKTTDLTLGPWLANPIREDQ